eukprot:TRINITY_DN4042_c0_g2_i1.p1 TRINITY_DN4042_c0_g2~~TRINITY_DN4042_c0_g2_i1.p1  ORF type:complete len:660 (+),score=171.38 TRINITY_DN4042_c0_g2_i1:216-1982(+)
MVATETQEGGKDPGNHGGGNYGGGNYGGGDIGDLTFMDDPPKPVPSLPNFPSSPTFVPSSSTYVPSSPNFGPKPVPFSPQPEDKSLKQSYTQKYKGSTDKNWQFSPFSVDTNAFVNFLRKKPKLDAVLMYVEENKITDFNTKDSKGVPPLAVALENGQEDLVSWMVQKGADVNITGSDGNPLLFFTLTFPEHNRAAMFKLLLQKGANPELKDVDGEKLENYSLCATMKYWLQRALLVKIYMPSLRETFSKVQILGILESYFTLVGQEIATDTIVERIYAKKVDPKRDRKPVVLFLVGPPGHGKSEIGKSIGSHLSPADLVTINCASISDGKWGLFGAEAGYVGSGQSTDISAFIKKHDGRFGVCVLEEFEKLGQDAREALLHPFESGEWANKDFGGSKPSDCSQIIFIITSNLINEEITEKLMAENLIQLFAEAEDQETRRSIRNDILELVEGMVKTELKKKKPIEFARRVSVIPFVTLSQNEQRIIALNEENRMTNRYYKPPDEHRQVGNIYMKFSQGFTKKVIEDYDPLQGASSLKSPVQDQVDKILLEVQKRQPAPTVVYFYIGKYGGFQFSFEEPATTDSFDPI